MRVARARTVRIGNGAEHEELGEAEPEVKLQHALHAIGNDLPLELVAHQPPLHLDLHFGLVTRQCFHWRLCAQNARYEYI